MTAAGLLALFASFGSVLSHCPPPPAPEGPASSPSALLQHLAELRRNHLGRAAFRHLRQASLRLLLAAIDFAGVVHNLLNRHAVIVETERFGMIPVGRPEHGTPEGIALLTMDIYYSFLNCGFSLPVLAGSTSGVLPSPLGFSRGLCPPTWNIRI
jgi:hypothetical protein